MQPACVKSEDDEPCKGYQIIRAHLDVEREVQAKLIIERDKWYNEAMRYRKLLARYRDETPLGHQPHMIAHEADKALGRSQ